MKLHLDFETFSLCDLKKSGVYAYAEHPTTEVLVARWRIPGGMMREWFPRREPMPADLAAALDDPNVMIGAHNSTFERLILRCVLKREIPIERFDCTAARAACVGLPRSLGGAAAAIGLSVDKDKEGYSLMLKMCKPRKPTKADPRTRILDDASLERLSAYCAVDVEVEEALDGVLPPLSPDERETWIATEEMNDRGVLIDADLLLAMTFFIDAAATDVMVAIFALTGERWKSLHHAYVTKWMKGQGYDDLVEDGVGKAAVAAMLERDDLPPLVRDVMLLRQAGGGTASTKFAAMLKRISRDGRLRGSMVYCGAVATKRWSSRGVQLQNLLRMLLLKKASRLAAVIRDVLAGITPAEVAELYGPPIVIAGELLRPTIIASPGCWLARGDSKQIEARVLPWLAGAEWKLNAFRRFDAGEGPDLYKIAAAGIYKTTADQIGDDDPRRQIGKVSELALGFQGGAGALQAMARGYGIKIPKHEGDDEPADGTDQWIKVQWRAANVEVSDRDTGLWSMMERAAVVCMQEPLGSIVHVGRLSFRRNSQVLLMRLPSGGSLAYWTPRLAMKPTPWGEDRLTVMYRGEDAMTSQWREFGAYGGLWVENAVQATARDLMAFWFRAFRRARLRPVLLVHDEGVNEPDATRFPFPEQAAAAVESIMRTLPPWADGLPVAADSSAGLRYVKS